MLFIPHETKQKFHRFTAYFRTLSYGMLMPHIVLQILGICLCGFALPHSRQLAAVGASRKIDYLSLISESPSG